MYAGPVPESPFLQSSLYPEMTEYPYIPRWPDKPVSQDGRQLQAAWYIPRWPEAPGVPGGFSQLLLHGHLDHDVDVAGPVSVNELNVAVAVLFRLHQGYSAGDFKPLLFTG